MTTDGGEHDRLSQHQIAVRDYRQRYEAAIARAQAEVEKARADLRGLHFTCQHEGAAMTSHMGESCHHCFDCGKCDA